MIDPSLAVLRCLDVVAALKWSIRSAIQARAVLESGNDFIKKYGLVIGSGATTYNTLHYSLLTTVISGLARAYDRGGANLVDEDKASVLSLSEWMDEPGVRQYFMARAAEQAIDLEWAEQERQTCEAAFDRCRSLADSAKRLADGDALKKLKQYRNTLVAHTLVGKQVDPPLVAEAFRLLDIARDFTQAALLALAHRDEDLGEIEAIERRAADKVWSRMLEPALLASSGPREID